MSEICCSRIKKHQSYKLSAHNPKDESNFPKSFLLIFFLENIVMKIFSSYKEPAISESMVKTTPQQVQKKSTK